MEIQGFYITLKPLTLKDRSRFFKWATQSDATPYWYGKLYGDEIPNYPDFKHDWQKHYFDGSAPDKGRCFGIHLNGRLIGEVNHNEIHPQDRSVELDILISDEKYMGKGYGPDAIQALAGYLFKEMEIEICRVEVLANNPRAIRAYLKSGFTLVQSFFREEIYWQTLEFRRPLPGGMN